MYYVLVASPIDQWATTRFDAPSLESAREIAAVYCDSLLSSGVVPMVRVEICEECPACRGTGKRAGRLRCRKCHSSGVASGEVELRWARSVLRGRAVRAFDALEAAGFEAA